jgi:hypothetical protein
MEGACGPPIPINPAFDAAARKDFPVMLTRNSSQPGEPVVRRNL